MSDLRCKFYAYTNIFQYLTLVSGAYVKPLHNAYILYMYVLANISPVKPHVCMYSLL